MPILSTFFDFSSRSPQSWPRALSRNRRFGGSQASALNAAPADPAYDVERVREDDPDMRLPDRTSLVLIILGNQLHQIAFFILVPSSNEYAKVLGGTSTFAGLVIGVPVAVGAAMLYPMTRYDNGQYRRALHISNIAGILGNTIYALGYLANNLYVLLFGRIVSGGSIPFLMYCKRYLSDPRVVGIRRRTTVASWLVVGQGVGFSIGPFLGGVLYKIGFHNRVFNGFTAPAWLVSILWLIYAIVSTMWFVDVEPIHATTYELGTRSATNGQTQESEPQMSRNSLRLPGPDSEEVEANHPLTARQKATVACMCWYAMTCFFNLGGWESNIPVFSSSPSVSSFNYSPYAAGNFIALGGAATFPLLFLNVLYARRIQDRYILASGATVGLVGLLTMLSCVTTDKVSFRSFYMSWFLVALGFNLASTCTLALMSKQLPGSWNAFMSFLIQLSISVGRVAGALWGGSGVAVGVKAYLGLQIGITGVGVVLHSLLWKDLKTKTG